MSYYHPNISGQVPAEAVAEVQAQIAAVGSFEREVCTTAELTEFAAADVAGVWGNIDPVALAAAALEA